LPILQLPMAIRDKVLYMAEVGYTYLSPWITLDSNIPTLLGKKKTPTPSTPNRDRKKSIKEFGKTLD